MKWIFTNLFILLLLITIMAISKPAIADSTNDEIHKQIHQEVIQI